MRWILTILGLVVVCSAFAQTSQIPAPKRTPFRLKIRSADPWFVKAMLEGIPTTQPEMSVIPGFGGLGSAVSQGMSKLFEGGHLVVNPTDNSLWFIPD
jgi:hypothetical protein